MTGGNGLCEVCPANAKQPCSGCGTAFDCGKEHQQKHWPSHGDECQPYRVVSSPEAGQYLVASCDLKAGQRTMRDTPMIIAPLSSSTFVCLGCTANIDDEDYVQCPQCHWPLCSLKCATSSQHKDECLVLAVDHQKIGPPTTLGETSRYGIIMILRGLLLRSTNPTGWKTLLSMASHVEQRMISMGELHQETAWYLTEVLKMDYDTDVVHHVYGAVATNAIEFQSDKGTTVRALYPKIRLHNHSCIPNVHLTCSDHGVMEARTAVDVASGAPLHICYTGTTTPCWERQMYLHDSYHFLCSCSRCNDPTELGTYFSYPRCSVCEENYLQPYTEEGEIVWRCPECIFQLSNSALQKEIITWVSRLEEEKLFGGSSSEKVKAVLDEAEKAFHPSHYIWMKVAQSALRTMRNNEPSLATLKLRRDLWIRLLHLYGTFEPGLTKRRGMSLFETAKAIHAATIHEFKTDKTTNISQLQTAVGYYREAALILDMESHGAMEATLAKRAEDSRKDAQESLARMSFESLCTDENCNTTTEMRAVEACEICGAREATVSCNQCEQVHYCCTSHRDQHLDEHKIDCQPTVIEQKDPVKGRYLVSARNFEAGELLFKEKPIALGPRANSRPVCLGCHQEIDDMGFPRCPKCLWPLCSPACATSELHKAECSVLAKDTGKLGQPIDLSPTHRYDCILVLRCLLLRDKDPISWRRLLSMASHSVQLALAEDPHHMASVLYIKDILQSSFDLKLIHHSRGAIMANCFEWCSPSEVSLRGMYPKMARINHSCYPNVTISSDCDSVMYIRAAVDLNALTPLSIPYTGITEPIWERQAYTNEIHYFSCDCERCSDPSELGLHYSSPKCETCNKKFLEPKTWLGETIWECRSCNVVLSDYLIKTEFSQWMSRFDCNDTFITSHPKGVRNVLEKVEFAFHSHHHVWVMAAQVAIRTLQDNKSRDSFALRKELWKKLLHIFSVLEPGMTLRRGVTLYELAVCEASLTQIEMREGRLTDHFYFVYMREALDHLQAAMDILRLEPPRSHEIRWYKKAAEEAEIITLDIKSRAVDSITPMVMLSSSDPYGKILLGNRCDELTIKS